MKVQDAKKNAVAVAAGGLAAAICAMFGLDATISGGVAVVVTGAVNFLLNRI